MNLLVRPTAPVTERREAAASQRPFRADIEGLRAIAVALVVAFHAGLPGVTGGYVGVDVFYVISGFLISGLLVDEVERTGSISFSAFFARRARRLLPMASLVIVAIGIGMVFFTAPVFRPAIRFDAISAVFYYSNWQFALESVNYLTLGADQNPVLHYWSLSVEEQFYLVWPILLLVAARLGIPRLRDVGVRRRCAVVVGAVLVGSLTYSLIATPAQPAVAYFSTTARAWEFAVGASVAMLSRPLSRLSGVAASLLSIGGLAALVAASFAFSTMTQFPGTAALAPVFGTAAVIAAGVGRPLLGAGVLLTTRPVRYVGRISYAWYLWHWPCLAFAHSAPWATPDGRIGWLPTSIAVLLSFALAALSHAFVEVPARRARWFSVRPRRALLLAGPATAAAILAVGLAGGPLGTPGAVSRLAGVVGASAAVPEARTPLEAQASTAYGMMHGCHLGYGDTAPAAGCTFGAIGARRTVVLVGDSHAAQWFPALLKLAVRERFRLIAWTKSGCPLTLGVKIYLPAIGRDYGECLTWQTSVLHELHTLGRTSMVIVGRTSTYLPQVRFPDGDTPSPAQAARIWGTGMQETVAALRRLARRVVVLRDTPHAPYDVPACISWNQDEPATCDFRLTGDRHSDDAEYRAERAAGVSVSAYADPSPVVCRTIVCHVVFHGEILFRDDNHLTAAFAALRWREFAAALNPPVVRRSI
jgi:peptidoglycan/LPS O-acetylase OafA/YrhL